MAGLPLEGLRVLDLSRLLPGPYCSMLLAQAGSEILKIEEPGGGDYLRDIPPLVEGIGAAYSLLNAGKRSLTLNLKRSEGVELLMRLIETADVLMEGFRPGVAERLGFGAEAARARNPRLVYCSLTGYGHTGPWRDRSGHDLNYMALSGALSGLRPTTDALPVLPALQIADLAGALQAHAGILAALYARERTGEGAVVDASMLDGAMRFQPLALAAALAMGREIPPGGSMLTGASACYGVYRTRDGKAIALAALEEKFWVAFCEAARHPEWSLERSQTILREALGGFFAERTRDDWTAWAANQDVCLEPVLTLDEAARHPQVEARGLVPRGQAAPLGADTHAVLEGLGLGREEIASLRARGVV